MTTSIPLWEYQKINKERAEKWHKDDINSWSLSDWACALAGETGEACNVVKKLRRAEDGLQGNVKTKAELHKDLAAELADTFTYLLCLASAANIDLETAFVEKFNKVSREQGFDEFIIY